MRRRSDGQSSASAGISTDGLTMPQAIGIVARALLRNEIRGETPTSSASSRASGSHGASITRSVRRDIHCTARMPMTRRARMARHPIAQMAIATIGQDRPVSADEGIDAISTDGVWTGAVVFGEDWPIAERDGR